MKILVTGVGGQLGHDVMNELKKRGHEGIGSDIQGQCDLTLDITDPAAVYTAIGRVKPDAVIHCAAWTAVDAAEDREETVRAINFGGTVNLATACNRLGCKMMYISTDYVFGGEGNTPWQPECTHFHPLNVYGRTKLAGELVVAKMLRKHFIIRISWAFGKNGNNFVKTILRAGRKNDTLRVVSDQIGTPTYTFDLARLLVDMIETEKYGCYHATNEGGYISWYDFACAIIQQAGYPTRVIPVTTEEYGLTGALRPRNSRLDKAKLAEAGFTPLPTWQDALARYLKEIEE